MTPIDLRSLEVFFWVVKLGGFSRAAEKLHMTQPAVSNRISQLETRLSVQLIDRGRQRHRGNLPTSHGLELFAYSERMLSLQSEFLAKLAEKDELSGVVRLGTSETLVHTMLGALIKRIHEKHPAVTLDITVDISPQLQSALLEGELDIALLLGPVNAPGVHNISFRQYEQVWVTSPDLPIPHVELTLADLVPWPLLSYGRRTLHHQQISELFRRAGLAPVRIFTSSSASCIVRMAIDGIGVGLLPYKVVEPAIKDNLLRALDVQPTPPPLQFTASYISAPPTTPAQVIAELARSIDLGA